MLLLLEFEVLEVNCYFCEIGDLRRILDYWYKGNGG